MKFSQSFSHFCTIKFGNKELMSEQTAKQQNKTAKGQWESDWLNFGTVKQFDDDWMNEWMNEWTEFHYILFFPGIKITFISTPVMMMELTN